MLRTVDEYACVIVCRGAEASAVVARVVHNRVVGVAGPEEVVAAVCVGTSALAGVLSADPQSARVL